MIPDRHVPRDWLPEWLSENPYQDDELPPSVDAHADTVPCPPPESEVR